MKLTTTISIWALMFVGLVLAGGARAQDLGSEVEDDTTLGRRSLLQVSPPPPFSPPPPPIFSFNCSVLNVTLCGSPGTPGLGCCNGLCTDLLFNPNNCGSCGNVCRPRIFLLPALCFLGRCV